MRCSERKTKQHNSPIIIHNTIYMYNTNLFVVVEAVDNWSFCWRKLREDIQELEDYILVVVDDG